jgi:hypothetical protein
MQSMSWRSLKVFRMLHFVCAVALLEASGASVSAHGQIARVRLVWWASNGVRGAISMNVEALVSKGVPAAVGNGATEPDRQPIQSV